MRYFYNLLLYLFLPLVLLRLFLRARKNPAYLDRLPERFGFYNKIIPSNNIWIHAVSVGEVVAAVPMVKALQKIYPHIPIVVTTTTPTGADRVQNLLGDSVMHLYLPYDFPDAIQRFFKKVKPQLGIIMETELWPNLLYYSQKNNVPMILANARLSARSAKGYLYLAKITRAMVRQLALIIVQTQADADSFVKLGADPNKIKITGSIKFDLEISTALIDEAKAFRRLLGEVRPIWIAASTHEGEEELILQAFAEVKKKLPHTLLVLVPRHPERFLDVANLCRKKNYKIILRTENKSCDETIDILVGDTMGELLLFYAAADVAYVGGSLVKKGGQNPLEPAAIGLPIIMGPHVFNFALINEQLKQANAAIQINNPEQLASQMVMLLEDKNKRREMGDNAREFIAQNRGALEKHLELIARVIENKFFPSVREASLISSPCKGED